VDSAAAAGEDPGSVYNRLTRPVGSNGPSSRALPVCADSARRAGFTIAALQEEIARDELLQAAGRNLIRAVRARIAGPDEIPRLPHFTRRVMFTVENGFRRDNQKGTNRRKRPSSARACLACR
jgi:hypothetical protein